MRATQTQGAVDHEERRRTTNSKDALQRGYVFSDVPGDSGYLTHLTPPKQSPWVCPTLNTQHTLKPLFYARCHTRLWKDDKNDQVPALARQTHT